MTSKRCLASAALLAVFVSAAAALPPSLVLGGYLEGGAASSVATFPPLYADASLQGTFGWRQALGGGGWMSMASRASLAPYLAGFPGSADRELLNLELGLPAGGGTIILDAGAESSFVNQSGAGTWVQPGWSAAWRLPHGQGGPQPALGVRGSYLYESAGADDRLSQAAFARLEQGASLQLGTYAGLRGTWELWTEEQAYDGSGALPGSLRQDWLAALEAGVHGFALTSVDWSVDGSTGLRWSDASTTSSAYSALALPGGSRVTSWVTGSVSWTPSSHAGVNVAGTVTNDWYISRKGENPDGSAASSNLDVLTIGGTVKLDWTPDGLVFLVFQLGAQRTFANRPDQESWNAALSAGVEYSF